MTATTKPKAPSVEDLAAKLISGDRIALARAITLIESVKPEDQLRAQDLLEAILPKTGKALRIGISGVPGAGKSTLIDQFGLNLIEAGYKVAVLAVDPTSSRSGGSILGDKTRMGRLASETDAYIRPSPAGDSLGGVTKTTRETIALVEAAGFDAVLVETVGVGQSETTVSKMVDVFVVVAIPGAGDELQGIKRGLLELADIIAVNKADGDNVDRAERAASEYRAGLHILAAGNPGWEPSVLTVSAMQNKGLDTLLEKIKERQEKLKQSGALAARRGDQAVVWMRELFEQRLLAAFKGGRKAARHWAEMEDKVRDGEISAVSAAAELGRLAKIGQSEG
ncbi:methylmalonyl Co-A mutase-associated GTPase MeaB [Methyloligella sp. 2.7D]|uniref:methylmalonyl Co-A mutase-associated GTPase MeaB n=1 Tax=unclassified Methyloligella TaxID=2625955 RepID=UPI00157DAD4A|nr:methylmalonyl Co-A mutase-associated GTPase MeaB [Methyloligella sp. GL2]QKP77083.1 methylmalonyl Co-A mutase-associated GTPase MeaB [Methyloligella sp. GL2]